MADRDTGQHIDPAKVHPLDHKGTFFEVRGPLNIGRCPQGRPVILQAGASDPGLALAARTADVVFAVVQDLQEAKAAYASLKARLPDFGRDPNALSILPGVMPILGGTQAEAKRKLDTPQGFVTPANALKMLSTRLGQDMSRFPLDAPVPDLPLPRWNNGSPRAPPTASTSCRPISRKRSPSSSVRSCRSCRRAACSGAATRARRCAGTPG